MPCLSEVGTVLAFLIWQADKVVLNTQEYHRGDSGVRENRKGSKMVLQSMRGSAVTPDCLRHCCPQRSSAPRKGCATVTLLHAATDEGWPLREAGLVQPLGPLSLPPAQQSVWSRSHHVASRGALPAECQHARPQGAGEILKMARLVASLLK